MPQTSPMNWMMISLFMNFMANWMSSSFLMKTPRTSSEKSSKNKKTMEWKW